MIKSEGQGRYLDPESVERYREEIQERRQKQMLEERRAALSSVLGISMALIAKYESELIVSKAS